LSASIVFTVDRYLMVNKVVYVSNCNTVF